MSIDPDGLSAEEEERSAPGLVGTFSRKWWSFGGVAIVLTSIVAIWFGISATRGISWNPVAVKITSPQQVDVTFDVTDQDGRAVSCTIVAYDLDHTTVGRTQVDLPASSLSSTRYTRSVRTIAPAVTGEVTRCELR
ncbi:DUF4307 domain-containing protein [Yimella sp. cx-51]|uniref:DUF4307 domain-containing protein n=1 Tax=Yimella sp. cx-51 TaxID=2770551 RepID=UPI00165E41C7|nr:DUF4307 domain-containing protein [Yimella sp. cx-51]MBC9958272.1 DUF4307 domain-containing protein [Yimella sp. cx-51]QTH38702.1 DUF4307 domain-containing protein [Yimella sp. cx-51]